MKEEFCVFGDPALGEGFGGVDGDLVYIRRQVLSD